MEDFSRKQLELNSLIEFSQLINTDLNLEFILGNILLSIMGKMLITKGVLFIRNEKTPDENYNFIIKAAKGISNEYINKNIKIVLPEEPIFQTADVKEHSVLSDLNLKYNFKIYFIDKLLGILSLGEKFNKSELKKNDIIFIETLLNLSSPTIENSIKFEEIKNLNFNLSSQLHHLRTLFELSKEFNTDFQNRDKIIRLLKYSLLGNFGIKDYIIFSKFRSDVFTVLESAKTVDLDYDILSDIKNIIEPEILSTDSEDISKKHLYENGFRLILPIATNNKIETVVCLGEKLTKTEFSISDIQFLESLINLCVISINNTVLFNDYINMQKIESELNIAREIQLALLPKETPVIRNYELSGCNIPALHIGGDYYDFIKLNESKYCLVIADVSGKGTPASLLMANIQSAVHSFLKFYDEHFDIALATQKINELIYSNTNSEKFITFFWGILDIEKNSFEYVNAGHNPPVYFENERFHFLDKGGLMLGVLDSGFDYEKDKIDINEKSMLLLYTDGVSEAKNLQSEEFTEDRLTDIIKAHQLESPSNMIDIILKNIRTFTNGASQFDDITMVALKRL